ncbi:MAG: hypothetical protein JSW28_09760, partial [Thermoplasmata archaeon]
ECDPTDPDSDNDPLLDGAETDWKSDTDGDGFINVWDQDSNDQISNPNPSRTYDMPSTSRVDYIQTYVVFRMGAASGDFTGYGEGTWIAVDPHARERISPSDEHVNLYYNEFPGAVFPGDEGRALDLQKYSYDSSTANPPTLKNMIVYYGDPSQEPSGVELRTPEGYRVLYKSDNAIYIEVSATTYMRYTNPVNPDGVADSVHSQPKLIAPGVAGPSETSSPPNFVVNHQEVYDGRPMLNLDSDFDGLENGIEILMGTNPNDADTDNDGVLDGQELEWNRDSDGDGHVKPNKWAEGRYYDTGINALDPDSDGDGLYDGTEIGLSWLHPHSQTNYIDTGQPKDSMYDYPILFLYPEAPDRDPATTTDPLDVDSDDDGLPDGWIDGWEYKAGKWGQTGVKDNSIDAVEGEDFNLNGRYESEADDRETDPNDRDSYDDDGITDGDERRIDYDPNASGIQGTSPFSHDTDEDGIFDATETGRSSESLTPDTDMSKEHFVPDADAGVTKTNPVLKDTDGDGLDDGEEDFSNLNGAMDHSKETEPTKLDTDGDRLLDGHDIENPLDPTPFNNEGIYKEGQTYFGELSRHDLDPGPATHMQLAPTEPRNPDTDGDGLLDGPNVGGKMGERELHYDGVPGRIDPQSKYTDPSVMDTDGDEVSDFLEVDGWKVTIIWEKTKEKKESRRVHSNPWEVDTDGDSLSDYQEFVNASDPGSEDTDGDRILDKKEEFGGLTQIEGKDPEIVGEIEAHVDAVWKKKWGIPYLDGWKLTVKVRIRDNAGLEKVDIRISGKSTKSVYLDGDLTKTVTAKFSVDFSRVLTRGYDIHVTVYDVNGNGNKTKTHFDGILEGIAKAIVAFFEALVKAIVELVSKLFDWIWDLIQDMINTVIKPIVDAIQNFVQGLADIIADAFSAGIEGVVDAFGQIAEYIFTNALFYALIAIVIVLLAIEIAINVATMGTAKIVESLSKTAIVKFIKPIILGILIASIIAAAIEIATFEKEQNDAVSAVLAGMGLGVTLMGMVASILTIWLILSNKLGDSKLSDYAGDIIGLVAGLIGAIITLTKVVVGKAEKAVQDAIVFIKDIIGLVIAILGARKSNKGKLDWVTWVGTLGDVVAYASVAVTAATILNNYRLGEYG